ncbi:amidase [Halobellus sp. Atlit-38R]|uniref:amidase n=1 Tax=Halobellus sp. Atlit-38R TaxID=2282131 RepID=UPI000EF23F5D|nr:amidase [Halobellus sp. Atlit-38R]RLM83608.1 amidase [Halobellus sp. Atlit-38R]
MASGPCFRSAIDLSQKIGSGEYSATEVCESIIGRIERRNEITNAYIQLMETHARRAARVVDRIDADNASGGALCGVPVAIKDNLDVAGAPTTFGAAPMINNVPEESDVAVERLRDASAVILGKTNMPEFGHRSTTDNPQFGPTSTPFDPSQTSGGSSGGSAAAVADGLATVALGTDGGGSLRIPASACGVYGHKPSAGLVPTRNRPDGFGYAPFVETGPITRTVADAAAVLNRISGYHPDDPFSYPTHGINLRNAVERPVDDLHIAWSPTLGLFPVTQSVRETVGDAVGSFEDLGASVEYVSPKFHYSRQEIREAWQCGFEVRLACLRKGINIEMGIDLLEEDNITELFRTFLERGAEYGAVEFKRADVIRTSVFDAVQSLFEDYDLLLTPTVSVPPFDLHSLGPQNVEGEEIDPVFGWCLTWLFNMTGHPAASVPAGFVDGLPVGMQVVGPRFRDDLVLAAAAAVEREQPWIRTYPGTSE